jgi:uncharacterized protein YcfL
MKNKLLKLSFLSLVAFLLLSCQNNNLQSKMNEVINNDVRNNGINVSVRSLSNSTLLYNLQSVNNSNSPADVFRVFLQFSEKVTDLNFNKVIIAYKGTHKFVLDGNDFNTMGKEYSFQNPVYTMRTFPEKLKLLDGSNAYSKWTGGVLGVSNKQIEDFNDFHRKWYKDEM